MVMDDKDRDSGFPHPQQGDSGGLGSEVLPLPNTGHFSFTRPAQPGDYCILLSPADGATYARLRQHQVALQLLYGGKITEPVHLTFQRFVTGSPSRLEALIEQLNKLLTDVEPFPVHVERLVPQFSPLRQFNIMKWQIKKNEHLENVALLVEDAMDKAGLELLYPPGWVSTLVTALEEVRQIKTDELRKVRFPAPLCLFGKVVITRIQGTNKFERLFAFPFPTH